MRELAFALAITLVACERPAPMASEAPAKTAEAPKAQPESVAKMSDLKSQVEVKRFDALSWENAIQGMALFNQDTVKTGSKSESRVRFNDGAVLTIEEKSTVTIKHHGKAGGTVHTSIHLPGGAVTGEVDETSPEKVEMIIRTQGGWIKIVNEDLKGKKTKSKVVATAAETGETKFEMKSGQGFLVTKEREIALTIGETVKVTGAGSSGDEPPDIPEVKIIRTASKSAPSEPSDVFKVLEPKPGGQTNDPQITVKGILKGNLKAFLNGKAIEPAGGRFSALTDLKPGLNLLIFQIVNTKTNAVTSHNLEVVRK